MKLKKHFFLTVSVCLMVQWVVILPAVAKDWTGASSSDWFTDGNWNPSGVPGVGESVVIYSNGFSPLLTNSTATLASLTIASGTLTCSNWATVINATALTVLNGGTITMPDAFANDSMSNRIHIVCSALTVDAGGMIDANEKGYGVGAGPGVGAGNDRVGGGGYGGRGGYASFNNDAAPGVAGGITYGAESAPTDPGSGAPVCNSGALTPGKGGGAILIDATGGIVSVNGTLSANGGDAKEAHAGGGSGGSIFITCQDFQGGLNGLISAQGGKRGEYDQANGGAGGGGRIAIIYQTCNLPSVRLSAARGPSHFTAGDETFAAEMGTVYLSTTNVLTPMLTSVNGRLIFPGVTSWSPPSLVVSNCVVGTGDNFLLDVGGDLVVTGATSQLRVGTNSEVKCLGRLLLSAGKLFVESNSKVSCNSGIMDGGSLVVKGGFTCGTDLTLTNSSLFYSYSSTNDGTALAYGSQVAVTGKLVVAASSWIYPCSDPVDGGSPVFKAQNITIDATSGFNAVGRGYGVAQGPGTPPPNGSDNATGGSHAGKGGKGSNGYTPGDTYGSSNAPVIAGSGSGNCYNGIFATGKGGGVIRLEVAGMLSLDGTLEASGASATDAHGAGGAGGGIFVVTRIFQSGSSSHLYANGGNGGVNGSGGGAGGGGGGGGRIALWVGPDVNDVNRYVNLLPGPSPEPFGLFLGTTSVTNGWGYYNGAPDGAEPGTVCLWQLIRRGTCLLIR